VPSSTHFPTEFEPTETPQEASPLRCSRLFRGSHRSRSPHCSCRQQDDHLPLDFNRELNVWLYVRRNEDLGNELHFTSRQQLLVLLLACEHLLDRRSKACAVCARPVLPRLANIYLPFALGDDDIMQNACIPRTGRTRNALLPTLSERGSCWLECMPRRAAK
jgi:hypothetical protein